MTINLFLILLISFIGLFVSKKNRLLFFVMMLSYWGLMSFQEQLSDTGFYYSAVIADLIVFLASLGLWNTFHFRVALISIGFIFLHALGYYLTFAYLPIYPYDCGLTVLYFLLVYTILTKGGSSHAIVDMLGKFGVTGFFAYRLHNRHCHSLHNEVKTEDTREKAPC